MAAADLITLTERGKVVVAYADLGGLDGLWVPEERTILIERALPPRRQRQVLAHELAHARTDLEGEAIDKRRSRPKVLAILPRRWWAPAVAAMVLATLLGGGYALSTRDAGERAQVEITPVNPPPSAAGKPPVSGPGQPATTPGRLPGRGVRTGGAGKTAPGPSQTPPPAGAQPAGQADGGGSAPTPTSPPPTASARPSVPTTVPPPAAAGTPTPSRDGGVVGSVTDVVGGVVGG